MAISATGALLADEARSAMLVALAHENALPASELAARAGVTPGTASVHLNKLFDAGWLTQERYGRHRYYRLAVPEVAALLESAAALAPADGKREWRLPSERNTSSNVLRPARTCYDHLAGRLGVALTDDLLRHGALEADGKDFRVTAAGRALLRERMGIDTDILARRKRVYARRCLDWTERRDHLAGALGAAICAAWLDRGWARRQPDTRALTVTPAGKATLRRWGIAWQGQEERE